MRSDPMNGPDEYLMLLDWRRRVAGIYAEVRARAARDPVAAHRYWRDERNDLFRTHPQSPLSVGARAAFRGLRYYDYNPSLAFTARVRSLPETVCEVATSGGGSMSFVRFGAVDLPVGTLEIMWLDAYGGGLLMPLADATSGTTTYGGGRYLLDTVKGADLGSRRDALVLDFNFAYHPSCAYNGKWLCPLAPAANRLNVAIEGGERL